MRIAITGSWRKEDARTWKQRDEAQFHRALRAIGRELIRLGHQLVLGSDAPHTADGAALAGVRSISAPPSSAWPMIELLRREGGRRHNEDPGRASLALAVSRPGFVSLHTAPANANVLKLYQVHRADVVLAAGGADKTLQAITAAAISGKRVVPIGAFGGAAEQGVDVFAATDGQWGTHVPPASVLGALRMPWVPGTLDLVMRLLGARHPRILIIHGRDLESRDALVRLLLSLGLPRPIVMANAPMLGRSLPEKFEQLALDVDAAIALVTPDDVGGLRRRAQATRRGRSRAPGLQHRARQNVWVEVGWFWGRLGRARTMLIGTEGVEVPSDLSGLLVEQFRKSPLELGLPIAQWIESLGWPRPTPRTRRR